MPQHIRICGKCTWSDETLQQTAPYFGLSVTRMHCGICHVRVIWQSESISMFDFKQAWTSLLVTLVNPNGSWAACCVLLGLQDRCAISCSTAALPVSLLLPADYWSFTDGLGHAAILSSASTTGFAHSLVPTPSCTQPRTGPAVSHCSTASSLSFTLWHNSLPASAASAWRRKFSFDSPALNHLSRCSADRHNALQWLAWHVHSSSKVSAIIYFC